MPDALRCNAIANHFPLESLMQVREIVRLKGGTLYTTAPEHSLASAIDMMAELDAGSLVVMQDGKMVGMLTFREILQALHRHERAPEEIQVGEVMVADPVTASPRWKPTNYVA